MKLSLGLTLASLIILCTAAPIPDTSPVTSIEYEIRSQSQKRDVADLDTELSKDIARYETSLTNFKANVGKPSKIAKARKSKSRKTKRKTTITMTEVSNGLFWTGPVAAGSSSTPLQMNFDTGSADTL